MLAVDDKETVSLNARNVPIRVRDQFKAHCASRRITMNEAIVQLIQKLIYGEIELEGQGESSESLRA